MAKCLVLGANGFIGSHLVDSLIGAGHTVRAFGRVSDVEHPNFNKSNNIEIFAGDFLNRDDLDKALNGIDYVFHFISTTTPATAENDPLIDIETNIKMSVNLFEECVKHKIKKVIFASTGGAIYGSSTGEPTPETTLPMPISPYAIGKLTIEHYLDYFNKKFGLDSLVFRISNPYGERHALHAKQGVISVFLEQIAENKPITILGDGRMVRDYIYVQDLARMIAGSFETASQNTYNLGSGKGSSINEIVEVIEGVTGITPSIKHSDAPVTFVDKMVLDVGRFHDEFPELKPQIELKQGVTNTWEYIKKALASQ